MVGTLRGTASDITIPIADLRYLKLDQTTPQTVVNGNVSVDAPIDAAHIANKAYVDGVVTPIQQQLSRLQPFTYFV